MNGQFALDVTFHFKKCILNPISGLLGLTDLKPRIRFVGMPSPYFRGQLVVQDVNVSSYDATRPIMLQVCEIFLATENVQIVFLDDGILDKLFHALENWILRLINQGGGTICDTLTQVITRLISNVEHEKVPILGKGDLSVFAQPKIKAQCPNEKSLSIDFYSLDYLNISDILVFQVIEMEDLTFGIDPNINISIFDKAFNIQVQGITNFSLVQPYFPNPKPNCDDYGKLNESFIDAGILNAAVAKETLCLLVDWEKNINLTIINNASNEELLSVTLNLPKINTCLSIGISFNRLNLLIGQFISGNISTSQLGSLASGIIFTPLTNLMLFQFQLSGIISTNEVLEFLLKTFYVSSYIPATVMHIGNELLQSASQKANESWNHVPPIEVPLPSSNCPNTGNHNDLNFANITEYIINYSSSTNPPYIIDVPDELIKSILKLIPVSDPYHIDLSIINITLSSFEQASNYDVKLYIPQQKTCLTDQFVCMNITISQLKIAIVPVNKYFICLYLSLLILSYLILSYLILSYLILSHLISSHLILSHLTSSYLILSYLILSYLILSHLILSHLILPHCIVSHLILPHCILSQRIHKCT